MAKDEKDFSVILCLKLEDGKVCPLAWSDSKFSNKEMRRATKKFMNDSDVMGYLSLPYWRLYSSMSEAKKDLPKF